MKRGFNENTKVTLTFRQLKRLVKEGRFTDRANLISGMESIISRTVKKYLPIISTYIDDLKDLKDACKQIDADFTRMTVSDGVCLGFLNDLTVGNDHIFGIVYKEPVTEFKVALGINLENGCFGDYLYTHNEGWHENWFELPITKIDEIIRILSRKTPNRQTRITELIRIFADNLPRYLSKMEEELDNIIEVKNSDV